MARVFTPDKPVPQRPKSGPQSFGIEPQQPKWVVKNMHRFREDPQQAEHGVAALLHMAETTLPEDVDAVLEANGAEAIVAAMQWHPETQTLQSLATKTLAALAAHSAAARRRVLEAGASEAWLEKSPA